MKAVYDNDDESTFEKTTSHEKDVVVREIKNLWMGVLKQSIKDYLYPKGRHGGLYKKQAKTWIFNNDRADFNSFIGICRLVGIDPIKVRQNIHNIKLSDLEI